MNYTDEFIALVKDIRLPISEKVAAEVLKKVLLSAYQQGHLDSKAGRRRLPPPIPPQKPNHL